MQSSKVVAGMDALSYPCENILTRRANQGHYSIVARFVKRPWPWTSAYQRTNLQGLYLCRRRVPTRPCGNMIYPTAPRMLRGCTTDMPNAKKDATGLLPSRPN